MTRFPIRYSPVKGLLLRIFGIPSRGSYVEIRDTRVRVRMCRAFRATFDRSRVESAARTRNIHLNAGVHGWRGRWLVNGASGPIVTVRLDPPVRAWVLGYPVRLRELLVSVADADDLVAALT